VRRRASTAARLPLALGAPGADGHQGPDHLPGPLEHAPGVVVAEQVERFVQIAPLAVGDPLVQLGARLAVGALEQEEVAILVDVASAEAEVPVDDPDRTLEDQAAEPGFLPRLPARGIGRRLAVLEVPLGKTPVVVGIANEKEARRLHAGPAVDDPARAHLQLRPAPAHQNTEILRYLRGLA
jgi:hypothetical protein